MLKLGLVPALYIPPCTSCSSHTLTRTRAPTHTHTHTRTHTCTYACTTVHIPTHEPPPTLTCTYTYTRMHTYAGCKWPDILHRPQKSADTVGKTDGSHKPGTGIRAARGPAEKADGPNPRQEKPRTRVKPKPLSEHPLSPHPSPFWKKLPSDYSE